MTKALRSPKIPEVQGKMDSSGQVGPDTDSSSDELPPVRGGRLARGVSARGGVRHARGRVRSGRARGRGQGVRRGRRQTTVDRRDVVAARNTQLQERIHNMPENNLRDLVYQLCQRNPSLVFGVLEECSKAERGEHHPPPAHMQGQPDWCCCSHCREMPTQVERVCCNQTEQNSRELELCQLEDHTRVYNVGIT
ncbi:uncharacterized protein LOC134283245 [Saccostrea cucullata]|uniref:uncharacterized protein LOC134283245 n=1 Tax=Saccostrea cuccullata TaxID=36930 RepID=UPI002ED108E0